MVIVWRQGGSGLNSRRRYISLSSCRPYQFWEVIASYPVISGAIFSRVKKPKRKSVHSIPPSVKIKKWLGIKWYIFLPVQSIILSFNEFFSLREVGSTYLSVVLWRLRIVDFSVAQQTLCGQGPSHYRGFTISLRHNTLGRTPLDEW
jgi:hypothetical protein